MSMCANLDIDMRIDMHVVMCIDVCVDTCIGMCTEMDGVAAGTAIHPWQNNRLTTCAAATSN